MSFYVLDYGIGNLTSVLSALSEVNIDFRLHDRGGIPSNAKGLIIPGVARYKSGIENLQCRGFYDQIIEFNERRLPLLGFCLGAQMLGMSSDEDFGIKGLSLVDFSCKQLDNTISRVPYQGWQTISNIIDDFNTNDKYFYFSHKFEMIFNNHDLPQKSNVYLTKTNKVGMFVQENIIGVQFHPEKSGENGLTLLTKIFEYYSTI